MIETWGGEYLIYRFFIILNWFIHVEAIREGEGRTISRRIESETMLQQCQGGGNELKSVDKACRW